MKTIMKTTSFLLSRKITAGIFSAAMLFAACSKDNSSSNLNPSEESFATNAAAADVEAEVVFEDVFDNVMGVNDEFGVGGVGVFGKYNDAVTDNKGASVDLSAGRTDSLQNPGCQKVTITRLNAPNPFPVRVVIDFGTGCVGRDGRTRKGKIITTYTGRMVVPGSVAETGFDGYFVNGIKVEGTHRIENQSTSNTWAYSVRVNNAKLTRPNGDFSQWNRSKLITQVEGLGTPQFPRDDVFTIRGEANGTVKRDTTTHQWATRTIEPLVKKFTCQWIVKGKLGVRRSNADAGVIDYGNGSCDNQATLTVNGVSRPIILH
jgi:hypothetical protein